MNRIIRSRVKGLLVILLLSLFVVGCDQCSLCVLSCMNEQPSVELCPYYCLMFGCPFPFPWAESFDTDAEE
jgi:hypothetical protein